MGNGFSLGISHIILMSDKAKKTSSKMRYTKTHSRKSVYTSISQVETPKLVDAQQVSHT